MFQQMVEFFFIVTATGNRDKHEKIRGQGRKKKIGGLLPQEESATGEEGIFFFSNWQSKGKNSWILIHTHKHARANLIF